MNGSKLIVAALGGNAISRADEEGSVEEQFAHSRATAEQLADLIEAGHQLVITHGNGPQIGNLLLRTELEEIPGYPLPMSVAEADIQGGMGYMIAQTLTNELSARGHDRVVATIITTVRVDPNDPDFANPSKPIGRFYDADQARSLREQKAWRLEEVSTGRFRRIVPSPNSTTGLPLSIDSANACLARSGRTRGP